MSEATSIRSRVVPVNGIDLHITEAGDPTDPVVLLCHGFPEGAYSWRHQLPTLAAAGFHVVAPDQRGYGRSSVPTNVSDYGIEHLSADLIGLLDELGTEQAVFVGHDWGALVVWDAARLHPSRMRAVVGVSVPAVAWPAPPTELFRAVYGDNFFYMLYFQEVGPAEAELEADPADSIRRIVWGGSGTGVAVPTGMSPAAGTGFLTNLPEPPPLPWNNDRGTWFTTDDLDGYARDFARNGFFGPISYYRNLDANFGVMRDLGLDLITAPTFFISGTRDVVALIDPGGVDRMGATLPDFRGAAMLEGIGHWTQQEAPAEFDAALLGFLASLD